MHKDLSEIQIGLIVGNPAVSSEFSNKVKELDRRLKLNGLSYSEWDTLNDRQQDIFSHNLFLDGESATSCDDYVRGAVNNCGCADTLEDLHHHSPVLIQAINRQKSQDGVKIKVERIDNLIDTYLDSV